MIPKLAIILPKLLHKFLIKQNKVHYLTKVINHDNLKGKIRNIVHVKCNQYFNFDNMKTHVFFNNFKDIIISLIYILLYYKKFGLKIQYSFGWLRDYSSTKKLKMNNSTIS